MSSNESSCLEWTGPVNSKGYGRMYKKGKHIFVHRVALEKKLGRSIKSKHLACHTCDNRLCINPDHLYEGTYTDNLNDSYAGDRVGVNRKMTQEWVEAMRVVRILIGTSIRSLAKISGVSYATMYVALKGETYR